MRTSYFVVMFFLIFISCKREDKIPREIIEKKRMQELMWDMLRADVFLIDFAGKMDSTFNRTQESILLYQKVLNIHNSNKEDFRKSLTWYQQHPIVMKIILDTLQKRQNNLTQEKAKPVVVPIGDSLKKIKKIFSKKK